ncbi:unnamed protein product [Cyprideis torosa]|uniref:Uncharacterized protein n=1 Tax=Cyprideis torosa TaxID=163714 RepID=A0A7R8ZRB7_9CRUS|nr:unnamed protein product [Cyprideis torosa]CAG0892653.1 unnamed protein product [Cyprideis torosa]
MAIMPLSQARVSLVRRRLESGILASLVLLSSVLVLTADSNGAVQLDNENFDQILADNEIVFVNFYADWCRFSNMLEPIWDEAAEKLAKAVAQPGKVIMGKVDCDKQSDIAKRFHITKYPTLKLMKYGQLAKREYRGQRSADAFVKFLQDQLKDPFELFDKMEALDNISDTKKRHLVGFYLDRNTKEFETFRKVASYLVDSCQFHLTFASLPLRPPNANMLLYRPAFSSGEKDEMFTGDYLSFDQMLSWSQEKCIPIVREITFENAEELTEEGLPFLILFYDPDDLSPIKTFAEVIQRELMPDKEQINFLTADGQKFSHPLHHLGKSKGDLPLIAIDSFRHMYLFPDASKMTEPGLLKQFIADLNSGKLHREFHWGPEEKTSTVTASPPAPVPADDAGQRLHIEVVDNSIDSSNQHGKIPLTKSTSPPESTFAKLAPSSNRYTLLRDEL